MVNIIWTNSADSDFDQNLEYLIKKFDDSVVQSFYDKTFETLDIIKTHPFSFQSIGYGDIRCVPIVPQVTLYYSVRNNTIRLLRFWNNHQDPKSFSLK